MPFKDAHFLGPIIGFLFLVTYHRINKGNANMFNIYSFNSSNNISGCLRHLLPLSSPANNFPWFVKCSLISFSKIKLKRQLVCQASGKGGLQRNKVEVWGGGRVPAVFCFVNDSLFFVMTVMNVHCGKARKFQKSMKKKMYYS